MNVVKELGLLRIVLILLAILNAFLAPKPGTQVDLTSWHNMITSLVAPAMAPIIFMVLLFDFMMCRIRMSDEDKRDRFRRIGYIELATAIFLFMMWLPFFAAIGG